MGGFTIEFDGSVIPETASFVPSRRLLTLTPRGIVLLARCGLLPDISKDEINDKSKADGISKSIACLQAAWFTVQIIARLVLSQPVTLLEVNTLGHVFAAFVIYMLWWHKPRMITEPTKLTGPWTGPLCAYMYMSSQISGKKITHKGLLRRPWAEPELSTLLYLKEPLRCLIKDDHAIRNHGHMQRNKQLRTSTHTAQDVSKKSSSRTKTAAAANRDDPSHTPSPQTRYNAEKSTEEIQNFSGSSYKRSQDESPEESIDSRRWRLAVEAWTSYPEIAGRYNDAGTFEKAHAAYEWFKPSTEQLVIKFAGNWPTDDLLRGVGGLLMGMVLWFASMAFGAIHAAAWFDYFPSGVEAWLWRASALWVTFSGLVWLVVNMAARLSKRINALWDRVLILDERRSVIVFFEILCTLCGILYIFARLYLILEAFISLRRLPLAAYDTPDWAQIIPHL